MKLKRIRLMPRCYANFIPVLRWYIRFYPLPLWLTARGKTVACLWLWWKFEVA